jgi:hypothetical protein
MSAQEGDRVLVGDHARSLIGWLALPRAVVRPRACPVRSSGRWRGFVGTWAIRDEQLWLLGLTGCLELASPPPVPATWVTEVLRLAAGPLVHPVNDYFLSGYAAVEEHDVVAGRVRRSRRLARARSRFPQGLSIRTPAWELLPELAALVTHRVHPLLGAPRLDPLVDRGLRARVAWERSRRGTRLAWTARRAEWERGERTLGEPEKAALCQALGIDAAEVQALHAADAAETDRVWGAWADAPVVPVLAVPSFEILYRVPRAARRDPEAWASACSRLIWRETALIPDRRTIVRFDGTGALIEKRPLVAADFLRGHRRVPTLPPAPWLSMSGLPPGP